MRTVWWCAVALVAALGGCRDEQAGPKGSPAPPAAPSSPMPPSTPQPPPQVDRGRILDEAPKDLTFQSGATFGNGAVQYLGTKLEPAQPVAGQPLKMSHY